MIDYAAEWRWLAMLHLDIFRVTSSPDDEQKAGIAMTNSVIAEALKSR